MEDSNAVIPAISILSLLGTGESARAQQLKGNAALTVGERKLTESEFEAQQLEENAKASIAAGQRAGQDEIRKGMLLNSSALARAAASGATASDPSVINTMAFTSNEATYRQGIALYNGEAEARLARLRAVGALREGQGAITDAGAASGASRAAAASTLFSGEARALSMMAKYFEAPNSGPKFDQYSGDQVGYSGNFIGGNTNDFFTGFD